MFLYMCMYNKYYNHNILYSCEDLNLKKKKKVEIIYKSCYSNPTALDQLFKRVKLDSLDSINEFFLIFNVIYKGH